MAQAGERTHYQVLGVAPSASTEEIRRAHRQLARVLHPDRLADTAPAERTLAERRMREVNAAWTTLSDPNRRRDYDRALAGATASTTRRAGAPATSTAARPSRSTRPEDAADPDLAYARARAAEIDPDEPDLSAGHFWLLRRGPVVLVVLVGLLLFVVTAYAGGNASRETGAPSTTLEVRVCVRNVEGRPSVWVSCEGPNDGRVVTFVQQPLDCPAKTAYVVVDGRIACATKDPTLLSELPADVGG